MDPLRRRGKSDPRPSPLSLFILFAGPTVYLLSAFTESSGNTILTAHHRTVFPHFRLRKHQRMVHELDHHLLGTVDFTGRPSSVSSYFVSKGRTIRGCRLRPPRSLPVQYLLDDRVRQQGHLGRQPDRWHLTPGPPRKRKTLIPVLDQFPITGHLADYPAGHRHFLYHFG